MRSTLISSRVLLGRNTCQVSGAATGESMLTVGPPQCSYGLPLPPICLDLRIHTERGTPAAENRKLSPDCRLHGARLRLAACASPPTRLGLRPSTRHAMFRLSHHSRPQDPQSGVKENWGKRNTYKSYIKRTAYDGSSVQAGCLWHALRSSLRYFSCLGSWIMRGEEHPVTHKSRFQVKLLGLVLF